MVCQELQKTVCKENRNKLKLMWESNKGKLRDKVKEILDLKENKSESNEKQKDNDVENRNDVPNDNIANTIRGKSCDPINERNVIENESGVFERMLCNAEDPETVVSKVPEFLILNKTQYNDGHNFVIEKENTAKSLHLPQQVEAASEIAMENYVDRENDDEDDDVQSLSDVGSFEEDFVSSAEVDDDDDEHLLLSSLKHREVNLIDKNCFKLKYEFTKETVNNEEIIDMSDDKQRYVAPPVKPSYKFQYTEKQFQIEREVILKKRISTAGNLGNEVVYTVEFDRDLIRDTLRDYMKQNIVPCVLTFYSYRNNEDSIALYSKCKGEENNPSHPRFKYDIRDLNKSYCTVFLYATDCDLKKVTHHTGKVNYEQLRARKRTLTKLLLQKELPTEHFDKLVNQTDINTATRGNFENLKPVKVLQQARCENKERPKYTTSKDILDVNQRLTEDLRTDDPYIRLFMNPFTVIMFSKEQYFATQSETIAYFDATGSVVRKPDDSFDRRVFYHALVVNKLQTTVPVLEMITSNQSVPSLTNMFVQYKHFVEREVQRNFKIKTITTDWCWASMNAIAKGLNVMSMQAYLQTCYDANTGVKPLPSNFVSIQSCTSHFQHQVSRTIDKKFPNTKPVKTLILELTGLLLRCSDLQHLRNVYRLVMTVLCTTDVKECEEAFKRLQCHAKSIMTSHESNNEVHYSEKEEDDVFFDEERASAKTLRAQSPYNAVFQSDFLAVKNEIQCDEGNNTNKYYAPGFAAYFTTNKMPFSPIWTAIILSLVQPNKVKLSNASVEGHFNIVKHKTLKSFKHNAPKDFIEIMRDYKSKLCKRLQMKGIIVDQEKSIDSQNEGAIAQWQRGQKVKGRNHLMCDILLNVDDAKTKENESNETLETLLEFHPPLSSTVLAAENESKNTKRKVAQDSFLLPENQSSENKMRKISEFSEQLKDHCDNLSIIPMETSEVEKNSPTSGNKVDDNSKSINAMQNGLFNDPEYYGQDTGNRDYIICRYPKIPDNPLGIKESITVFNTDFRALCDQKSYTSSKIIDVYAYSRILRNEWPNVLYLPTYHTKQLLGADAHKLKKRAWCMYNIMEPLSGRIFMPVHNVNHFVLFVADIEQETLTFYDSLNPENVLLAERYAKNFRKYTLECFKNVKNNLCDIQWKLQFSEVEYDEQEDKVNCGLFVIHYMDCLAMNLPLYNENFDIWQYRRYVAQQILERCPSMKDNCLACMSKKWTAQRGAYDGYMCDGCNRWLHKKCLPDNYNGVDVSNPNVQLLCVLCQIRKPSV